MTWKTDTVTLGARTVLRKVFDDNFEAVLYVWDDRATWHLYDFRAGGRGTTHTEVVDFNPNGPDMQEQGIISVQERYDELNGIQQLPFVSESQRHTR